MKHTRIILLIALLGAAAAGLPSLRGATITVTEVGDGFEYGTSLRKALRDANDGDTIEFAPQLGGYTLGLMPALGELVVNKSVTISWVPQVGYPTYLGVSPWYASRVFYISPGKTVTISGLTILNGSAPDPDRCGSGIYNDHATLTLKNCTISGNSIDWGTGGGIFNNGYGGSATLTITNCTISGNSTIPGHGAGVANFDGTVTITNSTISGNSAGLDGGGGILNGGTLTITSSTVSGNSSLSYGGGIYNWYQATLTTTNSTFSGNFCGDSAYDHGGGIYNNGTLKIGHTIFSAGPSGENIYNDINGTVMSLGYNLSSDNGGGYLTATGDRINTDPRLGPLQDNGGPIFTHLPASDSPAMDAGDPTQGMDQRGAGFQRVVNGRVDIGAVEVQATPAPTPTPTPTPTPHGQGRGRH